MQDKHESVLLKQHIHLILQSLKSVSQIMYTVGLYDTPAYHFHPLMYTICFDSSALHCNWNQNNEPGVAQILQVGPPVTTVPLKHTLLVI